MEKIGLKYEGERKEGIFYYYGVTIAPSILSNPIIYTSSPCFFIMNI